MLDLRRALERRAVSARETPGSVGWAPAKVHVGITVVRTIRAVAVADLQVHRIGGAAIDEVMAVLGARRKSGTHPRAEQLLARFGAQHHLALEYEHELVLVGVPVAHRGLLAGREHRVIDADAGETERIPDAALAARQHARAIGLGITAAVHCFDAAWIEGRFAR